jgi:hypothetical protein
MRIIGVVLVLTGAFFNIPASAQAKIAMNRARIVSISVIQDDKKGLLLGRHERRIARLEKVWAEKQGTPTSTPSNAMRPHNKTPRALKKCGDPVVNDFWRSKLPQSANKARVSGRPVKPFVFAVVVINAMSFASNRY